MSNCKCCDKSVCTCDRLLKTIDIELFGNKVTLPVNKTISSMGCFEYFYVGDGTAYYYYTQGDNTGLVPPIAVRKTYANRKIRIKFNPASVISDFTIYRGSDIRFYQPMFAKYGKILQENNILIIEIPDERLDPWSIALNYKDEQIVVATNEVQAPQSFNDTKFTELHNSNATDISEHLDRYAADLDWKNEVVLCSTLDVEGGIAGSESQGTGVLLPECDTQSRIIYYSSSCKTLQGFEVSGCCKVTTKYTGFLIVYTGNEPNGLLVDPTYYTEMTENTYPDKIFYNYKEKEYRSYCQLRRNFQNPAGEGFTHEPNI